MFQTQILKTHTGSERIILRIAFVIGNLSVGFEAYRETLVANQELVPLVMQLIFKHQNGSSECLGKLVRAIGNLSLLPAVGKACAASQTLIRALAHVLETPRSSEHDDIVLIAIATLANFTFFMEIEQCQVWMGTPFRPLLCCYSFLQPCI